ncbi:Dot/Icm secretion system substrate [Legionella busanensis]|uniref:Dot/Icm secretion system substrate n=1 Tax=Legionella busanensis TaxID=190655 RepID=A0A378JGW4_9GAMM|nr:hypothetical protein [Legionella busanensis]STX50237.1 Dot/Icm secretion system substrate [Legionella busanensis]
MSAYLQAPNKDAILKALEVASLSPEAAKYLCERLSETFSKVKIEASNEVWERVRQFAENVSIRYGKSSDPWTGRPDDIKTDFENAQHNMAVALLDEVSPSLADGQLNMDFAISDDAQLLRAFSLNEKPLDAKTATAMDTLFNSWLAENEMVSQDSVIYEADRNGRIKEDKNGQPTKANAERVRQLIADRDNGFAPFLNDKFKAHTPHQNLKASVQQHAYPEQAPVVEQPAEPVSTPAPETRSPAPTAAEAAPTAEADKPEPDTTPTAPSSSS